MGCTTPRTAHSSFQSAQPPLHDQLALAGCTRFATALANSPLVKGGELTAASRGCSLLQRAPSVVAWHGRRQPCADMRKQPTPLTNRSGASRDNLCGVAVAACRRQADALACLHVLHSLEALSGAPSAAGNARLSCEAGETDAWARRRFPQLYTPYYAPRNAIYWTKGLPKPESSLRTQIRQNLPPGSCLDLPYRFFRA